MPKAVLSEHLEFFRNSLKAFQNFSDAEWEIFSLPLQLRLLKKREHLVQIGEINRDIIFLASGAVRYYIDRNGEQVTNYFSFKGELTGAYSSFISGKPSQIAVDALEDCALLVLPEKEWNLMMENELLSFKMEQMRRKIAEYLILCYEQRVLSFLTHSPEQRYLYLLQTSAEVFRKIPQHHIAQYLGVTAVSLSRIRQRSKSVSA